jgi:coproporphyrinogen III oxidase-like Fe-S oxidoreductase
MKHAELDSATAQSETISAQSLPFEFMMNALRLVEGFESRLFEERTGLPFHCVVGRLDAAEAEGFIVRDHARVVPTLQGQRFLNDLLERFLD